MSCALKDSARFRAKRKDVPGSDEISFLGVSAGHEADCAGAVSGGYAGGDVGGGIDGDLEIGAEAIAVAFDHGTDAESLKSFFGAGDADESATVANHEVNDFWGDEFAGDDEVAFVFPVFVIYDDDRVSGFDVGNYVLDGIHG